MNDCAEIRIELGVYLLGASTAADRARVVRHLASCERCRDEVAGMAALPGLLRRLPARTAVQLTGQSVPHSSPDPASVLPTRMADRIARLRRRTHRWLTAAAGVMSPIRGTRPEDQELK